MTTHLCISLSLILTAGSLFTIVSSSNCVLKTTNYIEFPYPQGNGATTECVINATTVTMDNGGAAGAVCHNNGATCKSGALATFGENMWETIITFCVPSGYTPEGFSLVYQQSYGTGCNINDGTQIQGTIYRPSGCYCDNIERHSHDTV